MKQDRPLLEHMRDCINLVEDYSAGLRQPLSHDIVRDAVLRNLQLIAQSSIRLSDELKARHPEIRWQSLRAFRNVLVHDYLDVDLAEVELALREKLPALRDAVVRELANPDLDSTPSS